VNGGDAAKAIIRRKIAKCDRKQRRFRLWHGKKRAWHAFADKVGAGGSEPVDTKTDREWNVFGGHTTGIFNQMMMMTPFHQERIPYKQLEFTELFAMQLFECPRSLELHRL